MSDHKKLWRVFQLIRLLNQRPYKTVKQLASVLECSLKTVYRYMELLEELGYLIDKKEGDRYFMQLNLPEKSKTLFEQEEAAFLQDLLHQVPPGHPFREVLLQKLNKEYTLRPVLQSLQGMQIYENIRTLSKALEQNRRVQIQNYFSSESGLSTRIVDPVEFQKDYTYVRVYDLEKKAYRQLKMDRIGAVAILDERVTINHTSGALDMFGWSGAQIHRVILQLSGMAYRLLLEEFPDSRPFIKQEAGHWIFEGHVRDWRGIGRFILGLPGEVEVLEPHELNQYLLERVNKASWHNK